MRFETPHLPRFNRRTVASRGIARRSLTLATASVSLLALSGCGDDSSATDSSGDVPTIVTGFYPAQYVTQRLVGDAAKVTSLTRAGQEPHDVELSPDAVMEVADADLVIVLEGFQAAVDDAVADGDAGSVFDLGASASLTTLSGTDSLDYHFWLDPIRYGEVADALAGRLVELLPNHEADIEANLAKFQSDIDALDADYTAGLASCESDIIVTGHSAFGYLADRYGLEEHGIAGLEPEDEPSAAAIRDLIELVSSNGVSTVFFETLTSPDIAQTIANDAGAKSAVLDPIEGITDDTAGDDYFEVMASNLDSLRTGLNCS